MGRNRERRCVERHHRIAIAAAGLGTGLRITGDRLVELAALNIETLGVSRGLSLPRNPESRQN